MRCNACGQINPTAQKFCGECGNRLGAARPVPVAGAATDAVSNVLAAFDTPATRIGAQQGERKQVTVLFCDIVGSTPLAARLGADRIYRVLNEFLAVAMAQVHRFEGSVNQFLGDGFMALFGAPIMHEDHARRAALAALAVRDAVATHAWAMLPLGEKISIRIGINSGTVVFGRIGDDSRTDVTAIGDTANVAARLQSEARPGQVVCSGAVARAVAAHVELGALGLRSLKGKAAPVEVFELIAPRTLPAPSTPPPVATGSLLLGRADERASLESDLDQLLTGAGRVVAISGEAGVGKSRLLAEARRYASQVRVRWVQGTCVSYGKSQSYGPFRQVMRECLGISEGDDEVAARERLDTALEGLFAEAAAEIAPFVALLLGLRPRPADAPRLQALEGMPTGHQIFLTSLRVFERLAQQQALALVLDDWHWADTSSENLLEHLVPLAAKVPILFLVASRPEAGDGTVARLMRMLRTDPQVALLHREIRLLVLGDQAALELISRLFEPGTVQPQLAAHLRQRGGGNPFYLEELVHMSIATRAVERDAFSGEWRIAKAWAATALPDSIEGVILARVDRLDGDSKQLLKIAAVAGRSCSVAVLAAVAAGQVDLAACVERLRAAELMEDGMLLAESELRFRHPLIQQAVYDSLLDEQRRDLHQRTGDALERALANRLDEFYPLLAHHFARAEDWQRAQKYLFLAGTQAGRIAADAEALEHYENALRASKVSTADPDLVQRAELDASMAQALFRLGRNEAALDHALAALASLGFTYPGTRRETFRAIGRKLAGRALRRALRPFRAAGLGGRHPADRAYLSASRLFELVGAIDYFLDPPRFALGILTMLEVAETRPLSPGLAIATSALGLVCDSLGLYRFGAVLHGRALRAASKLGEDMARGYCLHLHGLHQYSTGQWGQALHTLADGARHLEAAGHLRLWASCTGATYFVMRSMGDPRWIELAERQLKVGESVHDEHAVAWAVNAAGVAHLYRGDHKSALVLFEKASVAYEAIPDYRFLAGALARRALCHALSGALETALSLLERSHALVRQYRISGMSASAPVMVTAEAYLCVAEQMKGANQRAQALRLAASACSRASRHARGVGDESSAEALRLNGILAWATGDQSRAARLWQAGIKVAQSLGADYALARLHHELGSRKLEAAHASVARNLFEKCGAAPLRADY